MNAAFQTIEARRAAAASQMSVLARVAKTVRGFAPGDERAIKARQFLRELTRTEQSRAAALLEDEIRAAGLAA